MQNLFLKNKSVLFLVFLFFSARGYGQKITSLTGNWEFRKVGEKTWNTATVPGTVHTDLFNNKKISDPFYRLNEKDLQWIDKEDWEYKTVFTVNDDQKKYDRLLLVFEGLDTYADIYLNGQKVLVADNMFRTWKADIKKYLKPGENELKVYFHSPIKTGEALYASLPFRVPVSDNDQASPKVSVFTRKAGYHYGWDWGPRFVTSGIWRPVYLQSENENSIEELFVKQKRLTPERANLEAQLSVQSSKKEVRELQLFVNGSTIPVYSKLVNIEKGVTRLVCSFSLIRPKLWWPNGYGAQNLYNFKADLKALSGNGYGVGSMQLLATRSIRQGLRTVEVVQESGKAGNSFYFSVNGVKIFMKGANYIPQDNFLPSVTKVRYEHIINTAVLSHMNMLRVWGGGIYENELFYNLCDEKGILIWQDFMFACAMQPPIETLKQNIYEEAVENVKRLRSHPSLAMWCGNNEIVAFMTSDYWRTAKGAFRNVQDSMTIVNTYKEVFHSILPSVVKAYDDDRFYWSTSPQGGNYSTTSRDSYTSGDIHYWEVWGNGKPIEEYLHNVGPFMSEYGFQSFPDLESVNKFTLPQDADINSEVMKSHQRSYVGNGAILAYMKSWYKVPTAFPEFLYVGQVLQGEAIKLAIEAHRRAKPFCMGSLYWQIDDCWPAASWSSMDYYGHWKALQYEAKRAFEPVLISPVVNKDTLAVFIVSDKLEAFKAQLAVRLISFDGKVLSEKLSTISIPANTSTLVYHQAVKSLLKGTNADNCFIDARLVVGKLIIADNQLYFTVPKNLNLKPSAIKYSLEHKNAFYTLTLNSGTLAKNVSISVGDGGVIFSDNYIDLLPGESKIVVFRSEKILSKLDVKLQSINDVTYKSQ